MEKYIIIDGQIHYFDQENEESLMDILLNILEKAFGEHVLRDTALRSILINSELLTTPEQKLLYYQALIYHFNRSMKQQERGIVITERAIWRNISVSMYFAFDNKQSAVGEFELTDEEKERVEFLKQALAEDDSLNIDSLHKRGLMDIRLKNVLKRHGMKDLRDLQEYFTVKFLNGNNLHNLGEKTLAELKLIIIAAGLEIDEDSDPDVDDRLSVAVSSGQLSPAFANSLFAKGIFSVSDLAKFKRSILGRSLYYHDAINVLDPIMAKFGINFIPEES